MKLSINDTFTKALVADKTNENFVRQVANAHFSYTRPTPPTNPSLIHTSSEMLQALGIGLNDSNKQAFLDVVSGNRVYENTEPYAMCYGGHQFGNWAGQLGDGRAINLFELNHAGKQWAVQLKGAGKTPYSRTADGLAVLRSSVREYLCSEAMYNLGVPTTRALSLVLSGDLVWRDMLYDGNAAYEKGAIVCRVAPSFIRFGNFQILVARKDLENLQKLLDYTIKQFYPHLGEPSPEVYVAFFEEVTQRTMKMVLDWERVGFVHGVMNTDNMSILGLTIDYGPYGWLENYDPNWTPNTTDAQGRRYCFGNQANIALWNIVQLANAIAPLIKNIEQLQGIIDTAQNDFPLAWEQMMLQKIGLSQNKSENKRLIQPLLVLLHQSETDMTLFFRQLADFDKGNQVGFIERIEQASYSEQFEQQKSAWLQWLNQYAKALQYELNPNRKQEMNAMNPKYVLRNYMAQMSIDAAEKGDYTLIEELYQLLKNPYSEQPENEKWFAKHPDWAKNKAGCSMLSCSS